MERTRSDATFRRWGLIGVACGSVLLACAAVLQIQHEMSWAQGEEPTLAQRVSLSLEEVSLETAYAAIERFSGFQVLGVAPLEARLSLSVKDTPLDQVLDLVAHQGETQWSREGSYLVFGLKPVAAREQLFRHEPGWRVRHQMTRAGVDFVASLPAEQRTSLKDGGHLSLDSLAPESRARLGALCGSGASPEAFIAWLKETFDHVEVAIEFTPIVWVQSGEGSASREERIEALVRSLRDRPEFYRAQHDPGPRSPQESQAQGVGVSHQSVRQLVSTSRDSAAGSFRPTALPTNGPDEADGLREEETWVEFDASWVTSLTELCAACRTRFSLDLYVDRRWGSTRVYVSAGKYPSSSLARLLAQSAGLEPRRVGELTLLALGGSASIEAEKTELRAELVEAVQQALADLVTTNFVTESGSPFNRDLLLSGTTVPFEKLTGPQQLHVARRLRTLRGVPSSSLRVYFQPCFRLTLLEYRRGPDGKLLLEQYAGHELR